MRKRSLWTIAMLTGCCILAGCSNQGTQTDTAQQSQEESVADTEENTDQNTPPEKLDGEARMEKNRMAHHQMVRHRTETAPVAKSRTERHRTEKEDRADRVRHRQNTMHKIHIRKMPR